MERLVQSICHKDLLNSNQLLSSHTLLNSLTKPKIETCQRNLKLYRNLKSYDEDEDDPKNQEISNVQRINKRSAAVNVT